MCAAVPVGLLVGIMSCGGTNCTFFVGTSLGRTNSVPMLLVRWYVLLNLENYVVTMIGTKFWCR